MLYTPEVEDTIRLSFNISLVHALRNTDISSNAKVAVDFLVARISVITNSTYNHEEQQSQYVLLLIEVCFKLHGTTLLEGNGILSEFLEEILFSHLAKISNRKIRVIVLWLLCWCNLAEVKRVGNREAILAELLRHLKKSFFHSKEIEV